MYIIGKDGKEKQIEGIIFDLDGTVLDSMKIWNTVGNDYLKVLGIPSNEDLSKTFKTMSMDQAAEYYRRVYGVKKDIDGIIEDINGLITSFYEKEAELKPGVREYIIELKKNHIPICIATATPKELVVKALERNDILDFFNGIITCEDVGKSKEHPDVYIEAMGILGTDKEKTAVFEDAFHGAKTAKNAGFLLVGVHDASENESEKIMKISDLYIQNFNDIRWRKKMKTALSIAGSDSGGGAGIQADIKTMIMNGVFAMTAVTALTAQNTTGVKGIMEVTPDFLKQQIDTVFEDIRPDAVKIGMVASTELIKVIGDRLKYHKSENIVVDPVMGSTSGSSLIKSDAIETLTKELLPLAVLVTPNIPEAEVLSGMHIHSKDDMVTAAKIIGDSYGCSVLLKGGHSVNDANDLLYSEGNYKWFAGKRIDNPNTHGTGCTLSSAIASNLAKGYSLEDSVRRAKEYISGALASMLDLGKGSGPLDHGFDLKGTYAESNE